MPRQTSIQITEATERQIEYLTKRGYGKMTDIVRIAVDRMYRDEVKLKGTFAKSRPGAEQCKRTRL